MKVSGIGFLRSEKFLGGPFKRFSLQTLLAGMAFIPMACFHEGDPAGPACGNTTAIPCGDCDAANPAHLACYDAFTHEVLPVLKRYCVGCHGTDGIGEFQTGGVGSGLNFEVELAFGRMLMPSFGDDGATKRVVPGNPESSALYNKISAGADTVWYGSPMPQGRALSDTDPEAVDAIRKWIADGARPPGGPAAVPQMGSGTGGYLSSRPVAGPDINRGAWPSRSRRSTRKPAAEEDGVTSPKFPEYRPTVRPSSPNSLAGPSGRPPDSP